MNTRTRFWSRLPRTAMIHLLLLPLLAGCGGGGAATSVPTARPAEKTPRPTQETATPIPTTRPAADPRQSIRALAAAESQGESEAAIQDILIQNLSLGLLDEQGTQLNPSADEEAISMTPTDVAAYAMLSSGDHYRTIDYVVDFLGYVGATLDATGRPITSTDLLPDLQAYVDWSFAHPDDPKSTLGLLLASGPELRVPDSAPQLEGSTRISPLAGLLLLADLLVGLEQESVSAETMLARESVVAPKQAAPAPQDQADILLRVKGLITKLEYVLSSSLVRLGTIGLPEERQHQLSQIQKNLGVIKSLIVIYETADHLTVRILRMDGTRPNQLELKRSGAQIPLECRIVALIPGSGEVEVRNAPFSYYLHLMSGHRVAAEGPLFADADAALVPLAGSTATYKSDLDGHRLRVATDVAEYDLAAGNLKNEEERTALLFASAKLPLARIAQVLDKYEGTIKWLAIGVTVEELKQMVHILGKDLQILPTMSIVKFKAQERVGPTATARSEEPPRPKLMQTLSGHSGEVSSVAFSPDGARLVSVAPGEVFLWDVHTGERLAALEGAQEASKAIWSPDGQMLATAGGSVVQVWPADGGQAVSNLDAGSPSTSVAWSPDASNLAVGRVDGSTAILEAQSGLLLRTLEGHADSVGVVLWSPDGSKLVTAAGDADATGAGATAIVWDAQTGEQLYVIEGYEDAAWSPDGARLALWRADPLEELGQSTILDAATGEAEVSDDGIVQITSHGGVLRLWRIWWQGDLSAALVPKWDESEVHVLGPRWVYYLYNEAKVLDLSSSADGSVITCGLADGTVALWTVEEVP